MRLLDEPLEPEEVELVATDTHAVARGAGGDDLRPHPLAQPRDVHLERLRSRRRRRATPKLLDQHIGRDDLVRTQQEERKECPFPSLPDWEWPVINTTSSGPENSEVHVAASRRR